MNARQPQTAVVGDVDGVAVHDGPDGDDLGTRQVLRVRSRGHHDHTENAQKLHGATYVVDVEFRSTSLDDNGIVVDIGLATETVHRILGELNFRNLDDEAAFSAARMPVRELKFLAKLADDLDAMQSSLDD